MCLVSHCFEQPRKKQNRELSQPSHNIHCICHLCRIVHSSENFQKSEGIFFFLCYKHRKMDALFWSKTSLQTTSDSITLPQAQGAKITSSHSYDPHRDGTYVASWALCWCPAREANFNIKDWSVTSEAECLDCKLSPFDSPCRTAL